MKELIAYSGPSFIIEWFYNSNNESHVLDYFNLLENIQKRKTMILFKKMGDFGKIVDIAKFRNEGDGIYAFKPQPDRFLCFFTEGKKIIITSAFRKKTNRLPKSEKNKALKIKNEYHHRITEGIYYEK